MIYVTVSTGICVVLILDGKLYHGADGMAGEIGHMTTMPRGPHCSCGNRGCLGALASGATIACEACERVAPGDATLMADLAGGDLEQITAKLVARQPEAIGIGHVYPSVYRGLGCGRQAGQCRVHFEVSRVKRTVAQVTLEEPSAGGRLYNPPIMSLGGGGAAILLEALIRIKTMISMSDTSLDPCLELGLFSTLV
jgi:hypothetical protein